MYRTHNCGELRMQHVGQEVTLSGWVQNTNDLGYMMFLNLRDRYGITQLTFNEENTSKELFEKARTLGREFVIRATGKVLERASKNDKIPTGTLKFWWKHSTFSISPKYLPSPLRIKLTAVTTSA